MASGSRGRRTRARAGAPDAGRLASLSAADLVAHLNEYPNREYEFVQVALVLGARERRLAEAEALVRAADEVADMLRDEIRARERRAAEADAEIRRAAETQARLQAEIRALERRAADAKARLRDNLTGRLHRTAMEEDHPADAGESPRAPALLGDDEGADVGVVDVVDLGRNVAEAQVEEVVRHEEASEIVSGKRKELAVVPEEGDERITLRKRLKRLKVRGGRCSAAESESVLEPDPAGNGDVFANISEARTMQGVGENEPKDSRTMFLEHEWGIRSSDEPEHGYEEMSMAEKFEPKNLATTAVVGPRGTDLPNTSTENGQEPELPKMTAYEQGKRDGGEPEHGVQYMPRATSEKKCSPVAMRSRASEASKSMVMPAVATYEPRKSGMFYKMVFKALKEKEMERARDKLATAAASSRPNFRCWLRAPLPSESSVIAGEGSDPEAPQKE